MAFDPRPVAALIDDYVDWPLPGVVFKDLTPIMADHAAMSAVVDEMARLVGPVDMAVGIEARGWPFAAALAVRNGAGFVPLRKAGKLPGSVYAESYDLEYGTAELHLHRHALEPGMRVILIDDVLATGGTARAAVDLIAQSGAVVAGFAVLLEITALGGRAKVPDVPVHALLQV